MPKFLFTVIFLTVLSGIPAFLGLTTGWIKPFNYLHIFVFLISSSLLLAGLFSLIGFVLALKFFKAEGEPRDIYRKSLKISGYIAVGVFIFFLLRGFKLISFLNIILSIAFYLVLGYQLFFYGKKAQ